MAKSFLQRRRGLWSSAAARGGKDRASHSLGEAAYLYTQTIRRFLIETARV